MSTLSWLCDIRRASCHPGHCDAEGGGSKTMGSWTGCRHGESFSIRYRGGPRLISEPRNAHGRWRKVGSLEVDPPLF